MAAYYFVSSIVKTSRDYSPSLTFKKFSMRNSEIKSGKMKKPGENKIMAVTISATIFILIPPVLL